MEDNKQSLKKEESQVLGNNELSPGSGSILAEARKKQQRTTEEMASELNLSIVQIRTIESDQSEGLPEPTYVRGYIRSYAKLLGLNPEVVLENYKNPNWQKSANLDDMPRGIGSAEISGPKGFFTAGKIIGLVLAAIVAAFLWYSGVFSSLFSESDSVSTTQKTEAIVKNDAIGEADSAEKTANADTDESESASPDTGDVSLGNEIALTFSASSWVDIRDQQDNRLAYKTYTRGEELIIPIKDRISVFIANAEGVNVKYNGEPYDISDFREGVYAKFVMQ